MVQIRCQYCHKTVDNEEDFCPFCGGPLKARSQAIKKALEKQKETPVNPYIHNEIDQIGNVEWYSCTNIILFFAGLGILFGILAWLAKTF
ncbi:MAG: hypothetical protein LBE27_08490 [Deltaproteobacteria bacterium]|jgi:uncharacterized membrane protein YvbJ|nr:hypothetical protein [Deltaproteobacteria bacterium]